MKAVSLILLTAIALAALSPLCVLTLSVSPDGGSVIGNLDVCHSAAPALSSNGGSPCIHECPCGQFPLISVATHQPSDFPLVQFLLPEQNEKPPRS